MSELKFRPRFRIETSLEEKEVEDLVKAKLKNENIHGFESMVVKGHLILKINRKKKHFWSPQMDVSLSQIEGRSGTLIRCLLAPEPAVWTMFMFFYTATGFAAFVGLMMAMSQWTLEREMWGFYITAVSIVIGAILFFVAQFGKSLSKEEMKLLKAFISDIKWPE